MDNRLDSFFASLRGKKVYIIGAGVSNNPVAKLLLKKGVSVTLCDRKTREQLGAQYDELVSWGTKMLIGDSYPESFDADVIIRAPGVYYNHPALVDARKRGSVVTSEMELFFQFCPCPIYAVTGSEGKTTTTTIISEFLKKQGKLVHLGGNIGRGLFGIIEDISHSDVAVVELSSFQLMSMRTSPDVAVITNITPNHLDVHGAMEEYIDSKRNIFMHQQAFSRCVLNADNRLTASFVSEVRGEAMTFSRLEKPENGVYLRNDSMICLSRFGEDTPIMSAEDIFLPGDHNIENYMAAIAAVWGKVDAANIVSVAKSFRGVEYRQEFVRELDGVKYYNDSIATTPTRTIAALNAFKSNVILIGGGSDKKVPFTPLAKPLQQHAKAVILIGVTARKMADAITSDPDYNPQKLPVFFENDLPSAVEKARQLAVAGDIVALSPACASFDQYVNFEARGDHFRELVNNLK